MLGELARRLGAEHPGFDMTAWQLIDATLARSGYPDAATVCAQGGIDCARDFDTMHFLNGFGHADRGFHFHPDWAALGPDHARLPSLPDHLAITDAIRR